MNYEKFIRSVLSIISTQGVLLLINFGYSVITNRWLGPEEKGQYSVALTVYSTGAQLGMLGLHSAHVFYLSKERKCLKYILGNSIFISLIVGGLIAVGLFLFNNMFPDLIGISQLLMLLCGFMIPMQLFSYFQSQTLIAIGKVKIRNWLDLTNSILLLVFVVLIYKIGQLLSETLLLGSLFIVLILNVFVFIYICGTEKVRPCISLVFFRKVLPYGIKSYISCLYAYLILRVDIFMVNYMFGDKLTGQYSLAVSFADMLTIISSAVSTMVFPVASACKNDKERICFVKKTVRITGRVILIVAGCMVCIARWIIPLLYGEEYNDSVVPFLILLPGVVAWGLESIYANFFASIKIFKYSIIAMQIVLNIFLNVYLCPVYGIAGAALASTISYTTVLLIMVVCFKRYIRKIENI